MRINGAIYITQKKKQCYTIYILVRYHLAIKQTYTPIYKHLKAYQELYIN